MRDPTQPDVQPLEPSRTSSIFNGLRISSRIIPAAGAARGGDWCEAFAVSEDVIALSIGDVCGHGAGKFDTMVAISGAIRDAALRGFDPAHALAEGGRIVREFARDELATAIFALLDTRKRSMAYANAGHPPPLLVGPYGSLFLEYPEADLPLGIDSAGSPTTHSISVPATTLIVLYTDGVSESERDSLWGAERLRAAAIFARKFPSFPTAATIESIMLPGTNFDDAAILTIRTPLFPVVRRRHAKGYTRRTHLRAVDAGAPSLR